MNGASCPQCSSDAVMCVSREGRTGSPCCWACREQETQRPLHVWSDRLAAEAEAQRRARPAAERIGEARGDAELVARLRARADGTTS